MGTMVKIKRKRGRPTTYQSQYCEMVIDHMKDGNSLESFAAKIGTHRQILWTWRKSHEEFDNACQVAIDSSMAWWEDLARKVATGEVHEAKYEGKYAKVHAGMITYIMSRRFKNYNTAF